MANTNKTSSSNNKASSSPVVVLNAHNRNGGAANIIIDKSGVYIPQLNGGTTNNGGSVQISIQSKSSVETPKIQAGILKKMNSLGVAAKAATVATETPSVVVMKSMSNLRFDMDGCIENVNGNVNSQMPSSSVTVSIGGRKMQPSMGITAASIKSKRNNIREFNEQQLQQQQQVNEDYRLYKKTLSSSSNYQCQDDQEMAKIPTFPSAPSLPLTHTVSTSDYECLSNYHSNDLYGTGLDKSRNSTTTLVASRHDEHVYVNVNQNHMNRSTTSSSISSSSSSSSSSTSKLVPFLDSSMNRNRSATNNVSSGIGGVVTNTPRSTSTFIDGADETVSSPHASLSPNVSEIESLNSRQGRSTFGKAKKMKCYSQVEIGWSSKSMTDRHHHQNQLFSTDV